MQRIQKRLMALMLPMALVLVGFGGIDTWPMSHADAAKDLVGWAKADPTGAKKFFEADEQHPDQTKDLVHWAADKPTETVDQYAAAHKGQPVATLISEHRATTDGFVSWTRKHKDAAKSLVSYPKGLSWAGKHLVK